jgi:hypothetical protein
MEFVIQAGEAPALLGVRRYFSRFAGGILPEAAGLNTVFLASHRRPR